MIVFEIYTCPYQAVAKEFESSSERISLKKKRVIIVTYFMLNTVCF